jgi:hypothetical protein
MAGWGSIDGPVPVDFVRALRRVETGWTGTVDEEEVGLRFAAEWGAREADGIGSARRGASICSTTSAGAGVRGGEEVDGWTSGTRGVSDMLVGALAGGAVLLLLIFELGLLFGLY